MSLKDKEQKKRLFYRIIKLGNKIGTFIIAVIVLLYYFFDGIIIDGCFDFVKQKCIFLEFYTPEPARAKQHPDRQLNKIR